jgi:hypothetical protein
MGRTGKRVELGSAKRKREREGEKGVVKDFFAFFSNPF